MGEGNHLSATSVVGQSKGRWMWLFGGAAVAIVASGLLMQYVRSTSTKADSDSPGTAQVGDGTKKKILAKVADESISYDLVAEECVKRYGREVLDDLIHRMIIQKACEKGGITVTDQEISDEISRIAKRFNLDVTNWLQMLQAERNISPAQYRQSVIFPMIALKKLATDKIDINDKDMNEAFVRNYGPRVKARMIMFDNDRRASQGWERLKQKPDDFEKLAADLSVDPGSRAIGGQIPPIARFTGNDAVEEAAFKLREGEFSGIIQVAPDRYIILKCEGRTKPVVTEIDEVRDVLYEELKESKIQAAVAKAFDDIKKHTIVDNYLTQTSNRSERTNGSGRDGAVQPASGQMKPKTPSAKSTATGPNKTSRQ